MGGEDGEDGEDVQYGRLAARRLQLRLGTRVWIQCVHTSYGILLDCSTLLSIIILCKILEYAYSY